MKKQLFLFLMSVTIIFSISLISCNKDMTDAEINDLVKSKTQLLQDSLTKLIQAGDTQLQTQLKVRDSLLKTGGQIHYSINVVSAGNSVFRGGKDNNAVGAIVTIAQNGLVIKATTGADGIAVFNDLRIGNVAVNVQLANHSTIDYIADITPPGADPGTAVRYISNMIPMFPITGATMATIQGKMTYESDLNNKAREYPTGALVIATIDIDNAAFSRYLSPSFDPPVTYGKIIKVSFSDFQSIGVVNATGNYTLKVPATASGIPIKLKIPDYSSNQTLLLSKLNGVEVFGSQTVRTLFGETVIPSIIPSISAAYAEITPPNGANSMVTTPATASAAIDNTNGISAINITYSGAGYAQPQPANSYYYVNIKEGTNQTATAQVYVNNGRISYAIINTQGSNYSTAAQIDLDYEVVPFAGTINVNGSGGITSVTISNSGGYRTKPINPNIVDVGGSGAVLQCNYTWNAVNYTWRVTSVTVTNAGTGYTAGSAVTIPLPITNATANVILTTGSISTISVTNPGAGYVATPDVVITGGGGSGAIATAHRDINSGKIDYVTISNPGTGFTSQPSVAFVIRESNTNAKLDLIVNSSGVVTSGTFDAGNGYYSAPTITIKPSIPGFGAGATAVATVSAGKISSIIINNGGSGYTGVNYYTGSGIPFSITPLVGSGTINAVSGDVIIRDIYLGTGKREIED